MAAAGSVDFVAGEATISSNAGTRALQRHASIDSGDTVRTGANGRAQIRFTDGAYLSLQPNTEFAVRDYRFDGSADGSERGFFALARGAMRAVTGLIGRANHDRYRIYTPTATIGIRGTGGRIAILEDGSTLINGTSGIWTLTNPAGTIDVPAGTSGRAPAAPGQPPHLTSAQPTVGPAQPAARPGFSADENRTPSGTADIFGGTTSGAPAIVLGPPLVSGAIYHVDTAWESSTGSSPSSQQFTGTTANAIFNGAGQLLQFTDTNSATFSGTHQEFGTLAGLVAWGRWTGPVTGTVGVIAPQPTFNDVPLPNEGFHYVVGIPATAMPTTGSVVFNLVGATRPTAFGGAVAPGTFSGSLNVNFSGSITLNATAAFPGFSMSVVNGTLGFTPGQPIWGFQLVPLTVSGTPPAGVGCTTSCNAGIMGTFYGPGAPFAGISYSMAGVAGAAVFQR